MSLTRFATGEGDSAERRLLDLHLDGCGECRAVVAVLAQTAPGTASKPRDPDLEKVMAFERLGEHYELDSTLGAGGMGVVVGARHRLLGHRVAIKVLRPSLRHHEGSEQRFLIEAKAGARLCSPHVARVLDGGRAPDGLPYLVMEWLQGSDGERYLSTHGVPSIAEALDLVVQVLAALDEAHGTGLVHRDLKPANLFLSRGPSGRLEVKVLDFGLAKVMGEDLGLTASQGFLGSPLYVAPEQLRRSSDVDARADVWGVGCLLYRFLTGRVPFPAESVADVVSRIQRDEPTPVKTLRPEVPEGLSTLVGQLLEKNPLKRPASVGEVALRLRPFLTGPAAHELDAIIGQRAPSQLAPAVGAPAPAPPRRTIALAVAAGLVGVVLGGVLPWRSSGLVAKPPEVEVTPQEPLIGEPSGPPQRQPADAPVDDVAETPSSAKPRGPGRTTRASKGPPRGMLTGDAGTGGENVFEGRE